jgi:hypothetical protein
MRDILKKLGEMSKKPEGNNNELNYFLFSSRQYE